MCNPLEILSYHAEAESECISPTPYKACLRAVSPSHVCIGTGMGEGENRSTMGTGQGENTVVGWIQNGFTGYLLGNELRMAGDTHHYNKKLCSGCYDRSELSDCV